MKKRLLAVLAWFLLGATVLADTPNVIYAQRLSETPLFVTVPLTISGRRQALFVVDTGASIIFLDRHRTEFIENVVSNDAAVAGAASVNAGVLVNRVDLKLHGFL